MQRTFCLQALELEEFRALERQITQDAGMSVRGSVTVGSLATARQNTSSSINASVRTSLESQHRQQGAAQAHAEQQRLLQLSGQEQPRHQVGWKHPASTQLVESQSFRRDHSHASGQAPGQKPRGCVTGNPFAESADSNYTARLLPSHHEEDDTDAAWAGEAAAYAEQDSRAQFFDQAQPNSHAEPGCAFSNRTFGNPDAWETASATGTAVHDINAVGQASMWQSLASFVHQHHHD